MGIQVRVVSWTRLFLQQRCFGGDITNFYQLYTVIHIISDQAMGMCDEFCIVEVLRPNTNLQISGEHISYIPSSCELLLELGYNLLVRPSNGYSQGYY